MALRNDAIKLGVAPARVIEETEEKKLIGGIKTASPGPIPRAIKGMSRASVPDATSNIARHRRYAAISFSNCRITAPKMNGWLVKTASIA